MKPIREYSEAYLNFCFWLSDATRIDPIAYANWIREHASKVRVGYVRSGEDNPFVYGRMQFTRAIGTGV